MKTVIFSILFLLLLVAALCGFFYAREYITAQDEVSEYAAMQSEYASITYGPAGESVGQDLPSEERGLPYVVSETDGMPYVEVDYKALLRDNPDAVGWLAIPDSVINYPVVQGTDNIKYLSTSFKGKHSSAGTPLLPQK